jgi:hypothetical protein
MGMRIGGAIAVWTGAAGAGFVLGFGSESPPSPAGPGAAPAPRCGLKARGPAD